MVHQVTLPDGTNNTAVVAALYKFGRPDPFLSKVCSNYRINVSNKIMHLHAPFPTIYIIRLLEQIGECDGPMYY